jgi:hypothetical protein
MRMLQVYILGVSIVLDVCFECFIWMLQKYIWTLHSMHVASIYFKCFIFMLQK